MGTLPLAMSTIARGPTATTDPSADVALLAGAAAGEEAAREALGAKYRTIAYLLALQLTGHQEDARDLAQDAMVRFFGNLTTLRPGHDPRPWLLTVVRNLARDLWRRRKLRPTDSIDGHEIVLDLTAPDDDPERLLQRREAQERLWCALSHLTMDKREILVLRDFHDLAYAEIAEVLGIPAGTVMSRLHAARTALRAALAEVSHG
jgi:RNA polymerase sigma-70 factor (ECF subfamily)